jgi:hypothetical protein
LLIVMVRAATVVLDLFAGVPTTIRQSPTATSPIVSVAVSVNVVVGVQLTAVWPVVLCTSMVVPLMAATLPLAVLPRPVGAEAAPAVSDSPRTRHTQTAAPPAATRACRSPPKLRDVVAMVFVVSLVRSTIYSLLSASIGARRAAWLAG